MKNLDTLGGGGGAVSTLLHELPAELDQNGILAIPPGP